MNYKYGVISDNMILLKNDPFHICLSDTEIRNIDVNRNKKEMIFHAMEVHKEFVEVRNREFHKYERYKTGIFGVYIPRGWNSLKRQTAIDFTITPKAVFEGEGSLKVFW